MAKRIGENPEKFIVSSRLLVMGLEDLHVMVGVWRRKAIRKMNRPEEVVSR